MYSEITTMAINLDNGNKLDILNSLIYHFVSFTYIVMYPECEKYLKYLSMYLYTFAFNSICI